MTNTGLYWLAGSLVFLALCGLIASFRLAYSRDRSRVEIVDAIHGLTGATTIGREVREQLGFLNDRYREIDEHLRSGGRPNRPANQPPEAPVSPAGYPLGNDAPHPAYPGMTVGEVRAVQAAGYDPADPSVRLRVTEIVEQFHLLQQGRTGEIRLPRRTLSTDPTQVFGLPDAPTYTQPRIEDDTDYQDGGPRVIGDVPPPGTPQPPPHRGQ